MSIVLLKLKGLIPNVFYGQESACQRTILHHDSVGCLTKRIFMDPELGDGLLDLMHRRGGGGRYINLPFVRAGLIYFISMLHKFLEFNKSITFDFLLPGNLNGPLVSKTTVKIHCS